MSDMVEGDKRGMLPIYVLVPMSQAVEIDHNGTVVCAPTRIMSHEAIGVLSDFPTDGSPDSMESIRRDLVGFSIDAAPLLFTREIRSAEGFVCCCVLAAVAVPTIESAQALPSFVPLYQVCGPALVSG